MMVELVDPSNSFNRMGGTELVGREYFCITCDSMKQSEEPQSRRVTKGFQTYLYMSNSVLKSSIRVE